MTMILNRETGRLEPWPRVSQSPVTKADKLLAFAQVRDRAETLITDIAAEFRRADPALTEAESVSRAATTKAGARAYSLYNHAMAGMARVRNER